MRQALVPVVAWSLATGAAVTLSWWGVHSVMAGTAYDPPRAVPIAAGTAHGLASPPPLVPATQRPESPSATSSPHGSGASRTSGTSPQATGRGADATSPPGHAPASPPRSTAPQEPSAALKSYEITGGRAVFSVGSDTASLVSATPDSGWQMQTWTEPQWLRVTFTKGEQESSVFYTWNGHPPTAEFDSR